MNRVALVLACAACGATSPTPTPAPAIANAASVPSCLVAGTYVVTIDLHAGTIAPSDSRITDTSWCEDTLVRFVAQSMRELVVGYDGSALQIEWPPGHPATFAVVAPCQLAITSQPMPAHLTFDADGATGTTTFSVATAHAPDTCTATGAKLALMR